MTVIAVGILSVLVLVGALWTVALRNLFRAALSLGVVLAGVAGLFIVLEAEFLGFVQILVYVGAILTLVVFAIMLTARLHEAPAAPSRHQGPAAVAAATLFGMLAWTTLSIRWPQEASSEAVTAAALGQQLITTLVLPFEVISLVFVAAIIGAIALAAPVEGSTPRAQRSTAERASARRAGSAPAATPGRPA